MPSHREDSTGIGRRRGSVFVVLGAVGVDIDICVDLSLSGVGLLYCFRARLNLKHRRRAKESSWNV